MRCNWCFNVTKEGIMPRRIRWDMCLFWVALVRFLVSTDAAG